MGCTNTSFKTYARDKPNIKCNHLQSDGPTAQYRNKNNFYLFTLFCKELKLDQATRNVTSANHGKGAVDGIGGTIKGTCGTHVANGHYVLSEKKCFN